MLRPFGPAAATSIAGLEIETDEDALVLSGTLRIDRDQRSLARLKRLSAIIEEALGFLESGELPEMVPAIRPEEPGPNPFD